MTKPKCAVIDLDEVLYRFYSHVCDITNMYMDTDYKQTDIKAWGLPDDIDKTFRRLESWLYISQPIFENAKKKVHELKEQGYAIIFMTARDDKFKMHTEFNLKLNHIKYDELYHNKNKALKINRLSEKYNVEIFVDDRVSTVNRVKRETDVKYVYLVTTSANRNDDLEEGVIRINNLGELREVE